MSNIFGCLTNMFDIHGQRGLAISRNHRMPLPNPADHGLQPDDKSMDNVLFATLILVNSAFLSTAKRMNGPLSYLNGILDPSSSTSTGAQANAMADPNSYYLGIPGFSDVAQDTEYYN
ncbi:hypothetical protein L218DRAFT_990694 [Marasmius fiardii PR-910]|nr:hypothetical protein L218DRAFT_990694 [Marasmius fiardii PR-910]